ncbi:MAG: copper resistance protein [Betaproteobacteria bacterium]|nr:MAG: copper resistance protein [Betaproteobacteria bacterium]
MSTLFDIFGFLNVVLRGLDFVAQSVLLGSVAFVVLVATPLAGEVQRELSPVLVGCRRVIQAAALAVVVAVTATTVVNAAVLAASLTVSWREVAGAGFVIAGAAKVIIAVMIGLLASIGSVPAVSTRSALGAAGALFLCTALADSHAAARLRDNGLPLLATGAHELGAALWLGGLPCFWWALRRAGTRELASRIGKRFSALAITGVALILAGAAIFVAMYIGSIDAVYGTAYGAMALTKSVLLGMLLLLGFANFRAVRRVAAGGTALPRVRRLVEVEMGIGFAVLMAAASITSMPPAVDLTQDRVTFSELVERITPAIPRITSPEHATLGIPALQARLDEERRAEQESPTVRAFVPGSGMLPPRNLEDLEWSEYNHHWAGLLVAAMGLAALAQRSGRAPWAKHWPLLFLLLAVFLFLRADPEVWPMGEIGIIESLKDPEVAQHRLFVLLIVAFALFEWSLRTGRIDSHKLMRIFPLLMALGGTLLLTHSHALGNVKEELLIDMTHMPIAVLGISAGWARWLEVEALEEEGRWAGWLWPGCLVLIGLLLLGYREA